MIELLVSLLIFAFGMLGLVGLQNRTLGYGQMSLYRSQATALADDILDRMRTDRGNAKAGNWNSALEVASADITGTAIANDDLRDWKAQVENLLPAGKASVQVTNGVVTVDIQWDERGATQTAWTTTSAL
jgi:type IV pilus assembly protein PilV